VISEVHAGTLIDVSVIRFLFERKNSQFHIRRRLQTGLFFCEIQVEAKEARSKHNNRLGSIFDKLSRT